MATQGLHQVQKQTQSLILAPQLRQSLKILQVPTLDLRATIMEELQTNPVLEELPGTEVSIEAESEPSPTESEEFPSDQESEEVLFGELSAISLFEENRIIIVREIRKLKSDRGRKELIQYLLLKFLRWFYHLFS